MGDKSGRTRKHILYYIAAGLIVASNIFACAPLQKKITEIQAHNQLEEYRDKLAAGSFEQVIQKAEEVISVNEDVPPADIAYYVLGEVYAHYDYERRDYDRSKYYFMQLIRKFPDSELISEAKTYVSLLDTIAAGEMAAAALAEKQVEEVHPVQAEHTKTAIETEESVRQPHRVVEGDNFEEAVQKNLQILERVGQNKPADKALYNLGLIYAHVDNPAKDYKKSQIYFHVLAKQFPDSEFADEARIWLGVFDAIEKIQQIDTEIEQQKKQLIR